MAEKFDNPNYNPEAGMKYLATHFEMFKPEAVKVMIADAKRKGVKIPPVVEAKARKAGILNSVSNAKFKVGDRVKVTWNPDGQKKGIVGKTGELLRISSEGTALVEIDGNEYFTDRAYLKLANSVLSINSSAGDRGRKALSEGWGHGRLVTWEKEVEEGMRGAEKIRKDIRDLESTLPQVKGTEWFVRINSVRSANSSALEKLIADGDNGKWDGLAWMPKVIGKGSLYPDTMKISGGLGYDQEAKIREAWKSGKYNSVIFYKNGTKKGEIAVNACVVRSTNVVVAKALNAMGRDKQDAASVEMWLGVFDNFLSSQAPKFKDKERAKAMGEKIIKDIEKSLGSEGGKVQLQKMGWTVQKMRDALAKALNTVSNAWADAPDAATAKRDIEQTVRKATEIAKKQSGAKATYKMTPNDYYWCGYIDLTFNTEEEAKKYNPYYLFDELGDNKSILPKWSWAISAFNYQKTGKVVRIFIGTLNT